MPEGRCRWDLFSRYLSMKIHPSVCICLSWVTHSSLFTMLRVIVIDADNNWQFLRFICIQKHFLSLIYNHQTFPQSVRTTVEVSRAYVHRNHPQQKKRVTQRVRPTGSDPQQQLFRCESGISRHCPQTLSAALTPYKYLRRVTSAARSEPLNGSRFKGGPGIDHRCTRARWGHRKLTADSDV